MTLKKIFILMAAIGLFYFLFTSSSAKNRVNQVHPGEIKKVESNIFKIKYSESLEQPLEVEYWVKCTQTLFSRKGLDFFICDSIHTSDDMDYRDNQWDKGHMAPAASFACTKDELKQTFSYLNCALQHENLNRGVWKNLEIYERELAKSHRIKIKIEVHFSKTSTVLASGATVPDAFTKTLQYSNKKEVYKFQNSKPLYSDFKKYRIN